MYTKFPQFASRLLQYLLFGVMAVSSHAAERDVKWTFQTNGTVMQPAVGDDGTIYISSTEGSVYAITPQGKQKWQYTLDPDLDIGIPAVGKDGSVYVLTTTQYGLLALDRNGKEKWTFPFAPPSALYDQRAPTIGPDGTIYLISKSDATESIHAIEPAYGAELWSFETPADNELIRTPILVTSEGKIRAFTLGWNSFQYYNGKITCDNAGACDYHYWYAPNLLFFPNRGFAYNQISGTYYSPYQVAGGGVFLLGWTDGGTKFNFIDSADPDYLSAAVLSSSNMVYFGIDSTNTNYRKLYALNGDTGAKLWSAYISGGVKAAPTLGNDGVAYVSTGLQKIGAYNLNGSLRWVTTTLGGNLSAPTLGPDGILYVGTSNGKLYAIETSSARPDNRWPMWHRDARHSNCAHKACNSSQADLFLTLADSPDPVQRGQTLTYSLSIKNLGPDLANQVVLKSILPSQVSFVSATAPCKHKAGTVTCTYTSLVRAATKKVSVVVKAVTKGKAVNTSSLSALTEDQLTINNTRKVTTTIQ